MVYFKSITKENDNHYCLVLCNNNNSYYISGELETNLKNWDIDEDLKTQDFLNNIDNLIKSNNPEIKYVIVKCLYETLPEDKMVIFGEILVHKNDERIDAGLISFNIENIFDENGTKIEFEDFDKSDLIIAFRDI